MMLPTTIFSNLTHNSKPKKEVNGTEMNAVQHCKSIQYNMKLSSGQKFFNNEVFIY